MKHVLCALLVSIPLYAATDAEILRIQAEIQAGNIDAAERAVDAAIRTDSANGGLYNLRGIIEATRNQTAAAAASFDKAIGLNPRLTAAYLNFGRACEMLSAQDPAAMDRAIVRYRSLLAIDPEAAEARVQLAELLTKSVASLMESARLAQSQNDLRGALGYLAHARTLRPDYAPIHFFFGVVCIELNLPIEAKKSLDKALALDPNNAAYNYARGSVELQGNSAWLAIPYFKKFVAAEPENPRGRFALAVSEFSSHDYEAAAGHLNSIVGHKETEAGVQYFLGRIAKVNGDWNAAADHLAKSIAAAPDYAESHAELGLAKMHLGGLEAARAEIFQALQLSPNSYLANANLLALYQRTKDPRLPEQQQRLRELDAKRSENQELMVRTIRVEP
jgi:tetratricopeptide (TPR) repeat protein